MRKHEVFYDEQRFQSWLTQPLIFVEKLSKRQFENMWILLGNIEVRTDLQNIYCSNMQKLGLILEAIQKAKQTDRLQISEVVQYFESVCKSLWIKLPKNETRSQFNLIGWLVFDAKNWWTTKLHVAKICNECDVPWKRTHDNNVNLCTRWI